ncbi:leucine-rich repeat protein soc-2-like [Melitaea cinxia]|uniref:leucine-rich repeat protein soc-2-like n=1 Tax=Melitaea cinxia TaxID=113334 RepID=UPI001E2741E1|nr:leucine-rich repeat protein soc-2-like [Melitaea cinxia]
MSAILKFIRENHILAVIEQAIAEKKSRVILNSFEITDIPPLLFTCTHIEYLYLHSNELTEVPVQITQLSNLTTLTLDYNNISELPPEIGNLKNLINLNVSYNPLKVLAPEIGELESLEAFWCNRTGLVEIPKEIGKLTKLDTFGARGNVIKSVPEEMTSLNQLRWLTLEYNQIESLPPNMDTMESLVHCNFKHNKIKDFPTSLLKCRSLMYLQLSYNQINELPPDLNTSILPVLETLDLRYNPISNVTNNDNTQVRYSEDQLSTNNVDLNSPSSSSRHAAQAGNATALRLPAVAPRHPDPIDEMDLDASSIESSEDWENSVDSSDLDVQYQNDDDRAVNEAIGMVLPELSRYASTAS